MINYKLQLLLTASLSLVLLGVGCIPSNSTPSHTTPIDIRTPSGKLNISLSLDQLAIALLNETDVATKLQNIRPQTIEFNEAYLARQWYDETNGVVAFQQAITKYNTAAEARVDVEQYGRESDELTNDISVGDTSTVYRDDNGVTYRFCVGPYGVRVTLPDTTTTGKVTELAILQYNKLVDLAYQDTITIPNTAARDHLPDSVTGGTLLGTAPVTGLEWLGTIRSFKLADLVGYVSGAERRWRITSRPDEIIEITVIEMETTEQASKLKSGLIGDSSYSIEIPLPDSISDAADAVDNVDIVELQAANDKYFIDISIYSPFGEMDSVAAKTDLVNISETVLQEF